MVSEAEFKMDSLHMAKGKNKSFFTRKIVLVKGIYN